MIFLTVGTHEPFNRLVGAVDAWCSSRPWANVFGQITDLNLHGLRPQHFEWVGNLSPTEYEQKFREAQLIVSHAGMGTIITAIEYGKPIVILPRRGDLHETRNDHQIASAGRFRDRAGIHVATTEDDLPELLDRLAMKGDETAIPTIGPCADTHMTEALRAFILGSNVGA